MADEYSTWLNAPRKKYRCLCNGARSAAVLAGNGLSNLAYGSIQNHMASAAPQYGRPEGCVLYTSLSLSASLSGTLLTNSTIASTYNTEALNALYYGPSSQSGFWKIDEVLARIPSVGGNSRITVTLWDMLWYAGPITVTSQTITSTADAFNSTNWPYAASDTGAELLFELGYYIGTTQVGISMGGNSAYDGSTGLFSPTEVSASYLTPAVGASCLTHCASYHYLNRTARTTGFTGPFTQSALTTMRPVAIVAKRLCTLDVTRDGGATIGAPFTKKFGWGDTGLATVRANPALMITVEGNAAIDAGSGLPPVVHVTFSGD